MKRIGILGGSSDQATADYYTRLNRAVKERLGGYNTAELIINSVNFAFVELRVRENRWDELATYLSERAKALEGAGADALICVSNTLHRVAPQFMQGRRIPLLHIVDPTAQAIRAAGLKRVALLGTKPAMSAGYLQERYATFGIEIVVPGEAEQVELDRLIFDELCQGKFLAPAKAYYLGVVDRMAAFGAEGVILGCTEIPLLISQADRPNIPMFDTCGLHVAAAIDFALS